MAINLDVNLRVSEFQRGAAKIRKESEGIRNALKGIGTTAAVAFVGFGAAIAGAVKQAARFEDIEVQFRVLTGSAEKATAVFKDLQDFAARTPFQFEGIAAAGKNLLAFGFTTEELIPRLEEIGNVAAATGSDFKELGVIFGQVRAAGKLTGERLLQLQERGIPILDQLAKNFGKTTGEIQKLVTEGKISFADFQTAFGDLSREGGFAFEGLEKRSQTLSGLLSTLSDNFQLLTVSIGNEFLPVLKILSKGILSLLKILRDNEDVATFAAAILGLGTALAGLTAVGAGVAFAIVQIAEALKIARIAFVLFNAQLTFALGATGLGLILVFLGLIATNWELIFGETLPETFNSFIKFITPALDKISRIIPGAFLLDFSKIIERFNLVKEFITGFLEKNKEGFEEAANNQNFLMTRINAIVPNPEDVKAQSDKNLQIQSDALNEANEVNKTFAEKQASERQELFDNLFQQDEELKEKLDELDSESKAKLQEDLSKDLLTTEEKKRKSLEKQLRDKKGFDIKLTKDEQALQSGLKEIGIIAGDQQIKSFSEVKNTLITLSRSKNKELAAIGKAAAIVDITISTAISAAKVFENFQKLIPFPPVSIPLGIAAAASVVAFGGEQISQVLSAQEGGVVTGGIQGQDSVPALLAPGELVVPAQNFDEVIAAVSGGRGEEDGGSSGGVSGVVEISFKEDAVDFLEAQFIERRNLNLSQEPA